VHYDRVINPPIHHSTHLITTIIYLHALQRIQCFILSSGVIPVSLHFQETIYVYFYYVLFLIFSVFCIDKYVLYGRESKTPLDISKIDASYVLHVTCSIPILTEPKLTLGKLPLWWQR